MDGRARLAKLVQPYIDRLPEGLFRQLMLNRLSERTGLDTRYLQAHFQEAVKTEQAEPPPAATHATVPNDGAYPYEYSPAIDHARQDVYQRPVPQRHHYSGRSARLSSPGYAIRQLLCNPEFARDVAEPLSELHLSNDNDSQLLIDLLTVLKQEPHLTAAKLIAKWYDTDKGERLKSLASLDHGTSAHPEEFLDTIAAIRKNSREADKKSQHSNFLSVNLNNRKPSQLDEETRKKYLELLESKRQSLNHDGVS